MNQYFFLFAGEVRCVLQHGNICGRFELITMHHENKLIHVVHKCGKRNCRSISVLNASKRWTLCTEKWTRFTCRSKFTPKRNHTCVRFVKCFTQCFKGQDVSFTSTSDITPKRNHTSVSFNKVLYTMFQRVRSSDVNFTSTSELIPKRNHICVRFLKCFAQCFKGQDVSFTSTSDITPKRNHTSVSFNKALYTMFQRVRCKFHIHIRTHTKEKPYLCEI